ncbi:carboxypeptidase Y-deficient, partial [Ascosphaera atra]
MSSSPTPPPTLSLPRIHPTRPDELVTRDHWQPRNPQFDRCFDPACDKRLTATTGAVNCRKCGKLFCGEHTMYQMKLSRAALHEPVRGVWCRVCETCYKSREGYNDHNGSSRDLTSTFSALRKPHVDKSFLEVARLEKRISRLTSLLASALPADQLQSPASPASPFTSPRTRGSPRWISPFRDDERKKLERTVVSWQDDASVTRCPFCQQEFATYTFRRHHCRTCGRVVCADPATGCSEEVGLTVAGQKSQSRRTPGKKQPVDIDVRLCKDCRTTLFSRADFQAETTTEPPDLRAYRNLRQFETGIQALLPRFQTLLSALQDPDYPPTSEQLAEAAKVRKRLMDAFANYDVAARRIRDLPAASQTQAKLQKAVYLQATGFLHVHMLPLKSLPKILKHAPGSGSGTASAGGSTPTPEQMSKGKGRDGSNVTNATDGDERDK